MRQLTGQDAWFLYTETPSAPQHIGHFAIYDPSTAPGGAMTYSDIVQFLQQRVHLAPAFRERIKPVQLGLDHPWWVEDEGFDLEYHVRHMGLPAPGDWRQLCVQVARIYSRPLDRARPLWEYTIIDGLDAIDGIPPGCFAVVSKVHHAAVDGVSGTELTQAVHDLEPVASVPHAEVAPPDRQPADLELTLRAMLRNLQQPMRMMRTFRRSLPAARAVIGSDVHRSRARSLVDVARTRFNGPVGPHRVVDGESFRLDDIRRIKSAAAGATVNDVVLSICADALGRYLELHDEPLESPLTLMAPISVRTDADRGAAGNRVSMMFVRVDPRDRDPMDLLHDVHAEAVGSKEFANAMGADLLTDYSQFVPGNLAALASRLASRLQLASRTPPRANTVVTNVPGPQVPLYFMGAKLLRLYGLGPLADGLGLFHTVFSYNGLLTITITADRDSMKDPEVYARCLRASFDALARSAGGSSSPSRRKRG